jgi:hypothetical protein
MDAVVCDIPAAARTDQQHASIAAMERGRKQKEVMADILA